MTRLHRILNSRWALWGGMAVLAILAVLTILAATRLGAGLTDDSFFYIFPARQALAGQGLDFSPRYGPLIPAVLVAGGLLGIDPQNGIRILNALLFGANVFLGGWLVWEATHKAAFAWLAAALALLSDLLIEIHSWAMSEPLFLFLILTTTLCIVFYARRYSIGWLIAAGITAGLGGLARYVGVTLAGAGALFVLAAPRQTWRLRLGRTALFGGLALLPAVAFALRNWLVTGYPFGLRTPTAESPAAAWMVAAVGKMLIWFIPGRLVHGRELALGAVVLVLSAVALVWLARARRWKVNQAAANLAASPVILVLAGVALLNLLLALVLSEVQGIIGQGDAFNDRYIVPIYLAALILLVVSAAVFWQTGRRIARVGVVMVFVFLAGTYAYRAVDTVRSLALNGAGFASARWHVSETIAYLNTRPEVPLVSTGQYGVYFWTGQLPKSPTEFKDPAALREYLKETGGYLVIIDSMPPEMYGYSTAQLTDGLALLERFSEGAIYQFKP